MTDGFWSERSVTSAPLTEETFLAAAEATGNQSGWAHPCQLGQHVVSPRALTRPGPYRCVNCLQTVEIPFPLIERA